MGKEVVIIGLYDFVVKTHDGSTKQLKDYQGSVVLVVNTASRCGYTPQYAGLQDLDTQYGDSGLKVLAFPCNQFGQQEPGTNEDIQAFCQVNYGVKFPVFAKIDVNGDNADPLYQYLTGLEPAQPIQWNFTKFLFGRDGRFIGRYEPKVTPREMTKHIEAALG